MTIHPTPAAEVAIDAPLVCALLREQHPDLADLPLTACHAGWDNQVYRLGDALAVRLPRRAAAAARDAARNADSAVDDDTWARARGWALAPGVSYLAHSRDDPRLESLGVNTVEAVLSDNG